MKMKLETIADNYLAMTPAEFEAWLRKHEATDRNCSLVLSALLSGLITDQWAEDNASADMLAG
jgi:uncharacterized protein YehS (DUF1456 family)